ncbi:MULTISPECIES: CGNR zinc finger domain-containing protein [unclassified Paenibacillus]|uniref:CGNR zinc finger domain-containing protein n=1 Tax=unclassified Paenibacillus TaxID=185978 RepID=UPI0024B92148|nr:MULTISPECIES: CGNR zinc finger domain-containing protein [unclassified Paenibacillus]
MEYYNELWFSFTFDLLNSYDPYYEEPERLDSPEQLNDLLQKYGVLCDETVALKELTAVRAYRDRLRDLIMSGSDEQLGEFLTESELRSPLRPRLNAQGDGSFRYVYSPPDKNTGSLADRILAVCSRTLGRELTLYGRPRLKVCVSDPCREIFSDHSKNRLQRFCSKRCSTRYHVKKHRESQ